MKIAIISDLHLVADSPIGRIDNASATGLIKLGYMLNYCQSKGIKAILQAGDFTDKPRSWALLPLIIKVLRRYKKVKIYSVFGQHDLYMRNKQNRWSTMLGVLARTGLVTILNEEPHTLLAEDDISIKLFGCSLDDEPLRYPNIPKNCRSILVIHAPIADHKLYPGGDIISAKTFLRQHNYDLIVCGDIHRELYYHHKGRAIVNTAPMLRLEAEEYNFKRTPHFYIYSTKSDTLQRVDFPIEPANKVLSRKHIEQEKEIQELLTGFTSAIKQDENESKEVNIINKIHKRLKDKTIPSAVKQIIKEVVGYVGK